MQAQELGQLLAFSASRGDIQLEQRAQLIMKTRTFPQGEPDFNSPSTSPPTQCPFSWRISPTPGSQHLRPLPLTLSPG